MEAISPLMVGAVVGLVIFLLLLVARVMMRRNRMMVPLKGTIQSVKHALRAFGRAPVTLLTVTESDGTLHHVGVAGFDGDLCLDMRIEFKKTSEVIGRLEEAVRDRTEDGRITSKMIPVSYMELAWYRPLPEES